MNVNRFSLDVQSAEVASDVLGRTLGTGPIASLNKEGEFHFGIDAAMVGNARVGLNRSRSGIAWQMRCPWDDFVVYLPLRGTISVARANTEDSIRRDEFLFTRKREVDTVSASPGSQFHIFGVAAPAVMERLGRVAAPIPDRLAVKSELNTVDGCAVTRLALSASLLLGSLGGSEALPLLLANVEESMTEALVTVLAQRMGVADGATAGGSVTQLAAARDFIAGHAERPLRLAEIAKVAGLSARALQSGFREQYGLSPMAFLQEVRLRGCRQDLIDSRGTVPISVIARRWGFAHLGRFSVYYRSAFGEKPSDTVRSHAQ